MMLATHHTERAQLRPEVLATHATHRPRVEVVEVVVDFSRREQLGLLALTWQTVMGEEKFLEGQ